MICDADKEISLLHTKVDLLITLGGDGTVLWVSQSWFYLTQGSIIFHPSLFILPQIQFNLDYLKLFQAASMFKGPVPPIVPFSMGSLGFMTPFRILYLFFICLVKLHYTLFVTETFP